MGFGALASALVGMFNDGTTLPMTGIMAVCAVIGLVILVAGGKRIALAASSLDVEEQAFEQIEKY